MISIIISKFHPSLAENLKENIKQGAGVEYEIIVIENGRGEMGLCEVYNKGALRAKYDILCYAHEDIEIQTMDWGNKVVKIFGDDSNLGLLGVAGSAYKPLSPSGWWYENAGAGTFFTNYIQSNKDGSKAEYVQQNSKSIGLVSAACVDGFWFCTRRSVALSLKFDESTFKGFHCYDIDFSLAVFQHYTVAICFDILIKHFSEGTLSRGWISDTINLHAKWNNKLPASTGDFSLAEKKKEEFVAFEYFIKEMLYHSYSLSQVFRLLRSSPVKALLGLKGFAKLYRGAVRLVILKYKYRLFKNRAES